jgi:hypothetical protein
MMRTRHHGPSRLRLRRRLLLFSAPVAIVALVASIKMISVVVAGTSASIDFARGDISALRDDVSVLSVLNVLEPVKAPSAAGSLAVLEGRLDQADARYSDVLSRTDAAQSCPVRVNLELVRETQGDLAARDLRWEQARERYSSALTIVEEADSGCFQGNTDANAQRRAVRNDAAARLAAKMDWLSAPPLPPPPPPPAAQAPEPEVAAPVVPEPEQLQAPLRLDPGGGDPIERLQRILEDTAGRAGN